VTILRGLGWQDVACALNNAGFSKAKHRGKGSHLAFRKADVQGIVRLVVVPRKKNIPIGTVYAIIKQAGLSVSEFLGFLK